MLRTEIHNSLHNLAPILISVSFDSYAVVYFYVP